MTGAGTDAAGGIALEGLDGSNPLGFLAALGTLRVLDLAKDDPFRPPRMWWVQRESAWRPVIRAFAGGAILDERTGFVAHLARSLASGCDDRPFRWAPDTTVAPDQFRSFALQAARSASRRDRRVADFAAAFASDALADRQGRVQDTALRTMSGAGHQHFLQFMRDLLRVTAPRHIETALFEPWSYSDDPPSLRWDPADDRRYALRWSNPSTDPIRTVRGANRLAIEALPLMVTAPRRARLETTGFEGSVWLWPLWEPPAAVDVVRSLLTHPALRPASAGLDWPTLREIGVVEVFRCERITTGKYRNFTPAVPLS